MNEHTEREHWPILQLIGKVINLWSILENQYIMTINSISGRRFGNKINMGITSE